MEVKDTPKSGTTPAGDVRVPPRGGRARPPPRWKVKERGNDLLGAAAIVAAWNWVASTTSTEREVEEAENLRRVMTAICDATMPQTMLGTGQTTAVYWWIPDIAERRTRCAQS